MISAAIALILQAAAPANAPPPPTEGRPSVIRNPDWVRRPSGEDLMKVYPKAALQENLAGRVVLNCEVAVSGKLEACSALSEDPPDAGFGEAALKIGALFRMRPQTRDGVPVGGAKVRIPLNFIIPATLQAAPVTVRSDEVFGEAVALDCRFRDLHLDNCLPRGPSNPVVAEVAVRLARDVTLPPTPVREGRIVVPLVFAARSGAAAPELVTAPDWVRVPTREEYFRAYPEAAHRLGASGSATLECRVAGDGTLEGCAVAVESPPGQGFGEAVLKLAPLFRIRPEDRYGLKVAGRKIRIPVTFAPAPPPARGTGND